MASVARTPLRPLQLVVALTFPFVVLFVAILTIPLYAGLSADDTVRSAGLAIYGVAFAALLGTLGSMLFGVLGGRGTLPVALVLPMGLVPMAAGLFVFLAGMNNVHSSLLLTGASLRAQLLASGHAEALLNWLAGTVLACGVWMGAAVTLGALGAGVPEGPRRRQLWGATGVCIGLGLFAFAMALELDPNTQLHRAYASGLLAPEQRALVMERSAALGLWLERAMPGILVALGLLLVGALAFAFPGAPRSASLALAVATLLVVGLALGVTARGWQETASVAAQLRANARALLTVDADRDEPAGYRLRLTAQGLRDWGQSLDAVPVKAPLFDAGRRKLFLELGADATTAALAQLLQGLALDAPLELRLVGARPPPAFAREQVPAWALALFEAPVPRLAAVEALVAAPADEVAQLEGEALVLGSARIPLTWAVPGDGAPGASVGLMLSPATPLPTLVKAIATVRGLGREPVLLLPAP